MTKEDYLAHITSYIARPLTPMEVEATGLWYDLINAYSLALIDTNEYDNPFDAPNYISVIVQFLEKRSTC